MSLYVTVGVCNERSPPVVKVKLHSSQLCDNKINSHMIISLAVVLCGKLGLGIRHWSKISMSVYTQTFTYHLVSVFTHVTMFTQRIKNELEAEPRMCASFEVNISTNDKQVPASVLGLK